MSHVTTIKTTASLDSREVESPRYLLDEPVYSQQWTLCRVQAVRHTQLGSEYKLVQKEGDKPYRNGDWQKEKDVYSAFG